jgi:hypothetical protein
MVNVLASDVLLGDVGKAVLDQLDRDKSEIRAGVEKRAKRPLKTPWTATHAAASCPFSRAPASRARVTSVKLV